MTVPHSNKPVEAKHYRHFTVKSLSDVLFNYFDIVEVIPFEKIDSRKKVIDWILTNNFFILNNNKLGNLIYNYYKSNLFFAFDEKNCQRLFVKAKKIDNK
jgi:hypothetical protein